MLALHVKYYRKRVHWQISHTMHTTKHNKLLHFYFLFISKSDTKNYYILILKDDASSFVRLEPTAESEAYIYVDTLMKLFNSFGVVLTWNSDRGTHFKNMVVQKMNCDLHARHHFTTRYCPQSSGTVESVCTEVLPVGIALLSEFRMTDKECPRIVRLIQRTLNHTTRHSIANRAPVTVSTGSPPVSQLRTIMCYHDVKSCTLEFVDIQRIANAEK